MWSYSRLSNPEPLPRQIPKTRSSSYKCLLSSFNKHKNALKYAKVPEMRTILFPGDTISDTPPLCRGYIKRKRPLERILRLLWRKHNFLCFFERGKYEIV